MTSSQSLQETVPADKQAVLGLLPLAPLTDEAAPRLPEVIESIDKRLKAEAQPSLANRLRAATYVLLGLRYAKDIAEKLFQGVTSMEDSVTYQAIIEKGVAKGLLKANV